MEIRFDTENFVEKMKRKAWEIKHDAQIDINRKVDWCVHNKEFVALAAPFVFKGVKAGYGLLKKTKTQKEIEQREKWVYDNRNGIRVDLRRKLTNKEKIKLDTERKKGRSVTEILNEMGLI